MNAIKVIGIDLAKSVFQVCVWMNGGSIAFNRKVSRAKLLDSIRQFPAGSIVAVEVCATSHYWGRTFQSMGFIIRLIPTQHVKALTHHQKNDANDALAICETALRPGIHLCGTKTGALTNTAYRHLRFVCIPSLLRHFCRDKNVAERAAMARPSGPCFRSENNSGYLLHRLFRGAILTDKPGG